MESILQDKELRSTPSLTVNGKEVGQRKIARYRRKVAQQSMDFYRK